MRSSLRETLLTAMLAIAYLPVASAQTTPELFPDLSSSQGASQQYYSAKPRPTLFHQHDQSPSLQTEPTRLRKQELFSTAESDGQLAAQPDDHPNACDDCRGTHRRRGLIARWKHFWHFHKKPRAQAKYWGYPEEFEERPHGLAVDAHVMAQVNNGRAAQMVLYQFDFFAGRDRLKPKGHARLERVVRLAANNEHAVIIEPSGNTDLDQARRATILRTLAARSAAVAAHRIRVAPPASRGLGGDEAMIIYAARVQQSGGSVSDDTSPNTNGTTSPSADPAAGTRS